MQLTRFVLRCTSRARVVALTLGAALACAKAPTPPSAPPLFELLPPERTGVRFTNALPESADFNILNYLYYYNGGGVAVGDVNGDGLPDLYFSSNLGGNRLYLNKGDYRFEDVTEKAGVAGPPGWKTGVTMADVNGDGRLDIYVSAVSYLTMRGHNVLYINNGDGTFADRTKEMGLEHEGYATQALFFDYDNDGDLDMYLLDHSTHIERSIGKGRASDVRDGRSALGDRLFRNDNGHFVDVSAKAGIRDGVDGYGLGIIASDVNLDGCMDLYVANDFQGNDQLYLNNCDGTFTESITKSTAHTSRFSMGVDAGDVNGDGRPDIFVADMLPERQAILNTSASSESYNLFNLRLRAGYHPQYARNTLQLNRGRSTGSAQPPRFSEIGFLAGVHASDWSWAPLFADLDNDGRRDLFITNGIYRRPNDLDYINFVGNDAVQASLAQGNSKENLSLLQRMPQIPLPNHAYRNDGGLHFTNVADAWGLGKPGFSNGAAYVDLNNSGALDLVINNINAPASIYRSRVRERNGNAYLTVALAGEGMNTFGIGAKVIVRAKGGVQMLEQEPTRGFLSSVDPRLHFGMGRDTVVDSLIVIWPDRRFQVQTNVAANRTITLAQREASGRYVYPTGASSPLVVDVTDRYPVDFLHKENPFVDFDREPLMPHLLSTEGPALAVGDVNGDGLDDLYIGGAKWQPSRLFIQSKDGRFVASDEPAIAADSLNEDVDAAFFDADGDGHPDLYVVSGGNEFWGNEDALRGRLYLNDGRGHFRRSQESLPNLFSNGSCVVPGDFDGDGHIDLFVGSRVESKKYGVTPASHLLRNDGKGHFVDVTAELASDLTEAGMVSSAAWGDYDGDGKLDLVVVGEWMPVRLFHQENGRFVERTKEAKLAGSEGWWNTVVVADLNHDGKPDLVLGNLGLNSYLRASATEPARLYVNDFAHNGTLQQVLTFYKHGVSYPLAGRDELMKVIPALRAKYPSYSAFGAARIEDLFPAADLRSARILEVHTFASSVAMNAGNGTFSLAPLPVEAQFAPIYAIDVDDFDGDGTLDLLVAGNFYGVPPMLGRYDASNGLLLHGTGDGRFVAEEMERSGVRIDGQVRKIATLRHASGGRLIAVARNDDRPLLLRKAGAATAKKPGVVAARSRAPRPGS